MDKHPNGNLNNMTKIRKRKKFLLKTINLFQVLGYVQVKNCNMTFT